MGFIESLQLLCTDNNTNQKDGSNQKLNLSFKIIQWDGVTKDKILIVKTEEQEHARYDKTNKQGRLLRFFSY